MASQQSRGSGECECVIHDDGQKRSSSKKGKSIRQFRCGAKAKRIPCGIYIIITINFCSVTS